MQKGRLITTAKQEITELFRMRNEYFLENDEYEETLELRAKRKATESALNPLKKGGLQCRTCHP